MTWLQILEAVADLASVATATAAVLADWSYSTTRRDKQKRFEGYLRAERGTGGRAIVIAHLVAEPTYPPSPRPSCG
jgi:hypothetical protein